MAWVGLALLLRIFNSTVSGACCPSNVSLLSYISLPLTQVASNSALSGQERRLPATATSAKSITMHPDQRGIPRGRVVVAGLCMWDIQSNRSPQIANISAPTLRTQV